MCKIHDYFKEKSYSRYKNDKEKIIKAYYYKGQTHTPSNHEGREQERKRKTKNCKIDRTQWTKWQ